MVRNTDTTGRFGFSNKEKVYFGGASIGEKWDNRSIEENNECRKVKADFSKENQSQRVNIDRDRKFVVRDNKPVVTRINSIKAGKKHKSLIVQKEDNVRKGENRMTHRNRVLEDVKFFFRFQEKEKYILSLHKEILDIRIRCYKDLESLRLQVKNLTDEVGSRSDLRKNSQNMSEDFYENNVPRNLGDSQTYNKQGLSSGDEVQRQDTLLKYRQNYDDSPRKVEAVGKLESIDFNKLVQPTPKISLNGSKIFLPPVKRVNAANTELGKFRSQISQIRQFIKESVN